MPRPRGSHKFKWKFWSFNFPRNVLYKNTQYKVEYRHLKKLGPEGAKHVSWARIMEVTIPVVSDVNSIGFHILMPPQVEIVHVYVEKFIWTSRGLHCIKHIHMSACNYKAGLTQADSFITIVRYVS